jgi:hypothetical protein
MVRAFVAAFIAVCFAIFSPASAQSPSLKPAQATVTPAPMRFEWVREGPAEKCGNRCREWISAAGAIVDSTVTDFEAFARERDVRGATIVLDSPGGNVVQGLALGREFRRLEITTSVGKAVKLEVANGAQQRAGLSPHASCNSMCVFLLLGGVQRHVPDEARILVHQIWPASKRNDANATTYSAANVVAIQRVSGEISRYIVDMGADIELFEISSRIPPWEEMRQLSREELRRLKVHTTEDPFSKVPLSTGAIVPVSKKLDASVVATANTLGWTVFERRGQRMLARQHPITIEGQEIGMFEIAFTCSDKPDTYRVAYLEKRIAQTNSSGLADRLEAVGISIRQDNAFLRTLLTVEESASGKGSELVTRARGTIAASYLEMAGASPSTERMASASPQGMIVATTTVEKVRTVIRLGQTGLSEGLRQLAATCDDHFPN